MRRRDAKQWYELLIRAYADYFENETISVNKWWKTRVAAERGLISCGAEAIPCAVELLANRDPEIREDGAAVLGALGEDERVVDALLSALEREDEKAIPFLATNDPRLRNRRRHSLHCDPVVGPDRPPLFRPPTGTGGSRARVARSARLLMRSSSARETGISRSPRATGMVNMS